jgi:hypothetical protein
MPEHACHGYRFVSSEWRGLSHADHEVLADIGEQLLAAAPDIHPAPLSRCPRRVVESPPGSTAGRPIRGAAQATVEIHGRSAE